MDTLYTWIILGLMALVAYGIYAYVKASFTVAPQRKPEENPQAKPVPKEEFAEEMTPFPEWEKKTPEPEPELPNYYNKDSLVLMARDPEWLYAYWEITASKQEEVAKRHGELHNSQLTLRVYDVTNIDDFNGSNANSYRDIDINGDANNWYFTAEGHDRTYCVDYGYKLADGRFITILRSNYASTPRAYMSDIIDDDWKPIEALYPKDHLHPGSSEQMH